MQSGLVLNLDAGASTSYPGSGTTWTDLSGSGNTGTIANGTYTSANGGSLVFDRSTYVNLGDPTSLRFGTGDWSFECWFKANNIVELDLINILVLVSLGTVCDVVPLIGLNRAIVRQGLKVLKRKKNLGLKTLIELNNIENDITAYHLGYILGPRINAGGRVGKSSHGANLLLNNNAQETFKIATELNNYNKERQILESELLNKILNTNYKNISDPVIILHGENWHEGIIGIIAARVKEKYNKPTIIISTTSDLGKGSARSIYGFDVGSTIIGAVQAGLLIKGGGHKMAAGFTISVEKSKNLKNLF